MQNEKRGDDGDEDFRQILLETYEVHEFPRRLEVAVHRVGALEICSIVAEHQSAETVERVLDVGRLEDPVEDARDVFHEYEAAAEENVSRHEQGCHRERDLPRTRLEYSIKGAE